MSFILDALKKSESARQRQANPALLEMHVVPPRQRLPTWAVVLGVLLLVNGLVLGFVALRERPTGKGAAQERASPTVATPTPAAAAPLAAGPAASLTLMAPTMVAPQGQAVTPVTPAITQRAGPAPAAIADSGADNEGADNPADLEPAVGPAATSASTPRTGTVPSYAALSSTLPPLRLDLHVYGNTPAERYAFINMHKVREGDVTPEGVRVVQITHEGVVLDFRGTEFLLGRE